MTSPSRASATYADLVAVPDNLVAEIIFGQLVTQPRAVPRHASTAMAGDEAVCAAPFDAITFQLGQLWPFDEPRSGSADSTN